MRVERKQDISMLAGGAAALAVILPHTYNNLPISQYLCPSNLEPFDLHKCFNLCMFVTMPALIAGGCWAACAAYKLSLAALNRFFPKTKKMEEEELIITSSELFKDFVEKFKEPFDKIRKRKATIEDYVIVGVTLGLFSGMLVGGYVVTYRPSHFSFLLAHEHHDFDKNTAMFPLLVGGGLIGSLAGLTCGAARKTFKKYSCKEAKKGV